MLYIFFNFTRGVMLALATIVVDMMREVSYHLDSPLWKDGSV